MQTHPVGLKKPNARSAYRNVNGEDISNDGTGFRVVIEIEER